MAKLAGKIRWSDKLKAAELPTLGFIEISSISRGLFLTDVVLKKAPIRVIASQPVSSGKHVLLFFGDEAAVEEAHQAAKLAAGDLLIRDILIHQVHEDLVPFLDSIWDSDPILATAQDSVGIVESQTIAGAILAADQALKTARVTLCRMRLGQGIGGKAYFVLNGKQEEVEAALDAAQTTLKGLESLARVDLIPRPQEDALEFF